LDAVLVALVTFGVATKPPSSHNMITDEFVGESLLW
jgi:hypothetical protein